MLLNPLNATFDEFADKYGSQWPLLLEFENTEQDAEWHAEGNVKIHTCMVMDEMRKIVSESDLDDSRKSILMFAALLHDYGKPITSKPVERPDGTHIGAPRHEEVGASLLIHTKCPEELAFYEWIKVIKLVAYHQMPKKMVIKDLGYGDYVRLMDEAHDLTMLALLEHADMRGRHCADFEENIFYVEMFEEMVKEYNLQCPYTFRRYWNTDEEKYHRTVSALGSQISTMDEGGSLQFNYNPHSTVTILCGLPGSGKSSLADGMDAKVISMDALRKHYPKSDNNEIHRLAMDELRDCLRANKDVVWDATNYRKDFRSKIAALAFKYGAYVRIIHKVKDVDKCIQDDKRREDSVGAEVILNQFHKFQLPSLDECHYLDFIEDNY